MGTTTEPSSEAVHEFEILLSRMEGVPLGMRVANDDQRTILIEDIVDGGAVAGFNQKSADKVVRPGDRIVAVNAVSGDASKVVAELQRSNELSIRLLRGAPSSQAPQPPGRTAGAASGVGSGTAKRAPEFPVVLDKRGGARLGLHIESAGGGSLDVIAVAEGGLAEAWNAAHPDQAIRPGDRIVEIGGVRGDVEAMIQECKAEGAIHLKVSRPEAPSKRTAGLGAGARPVSPPPPPRREPTYSPAPVDISIAVNQKPDLSTDGLSAVSFVASCCFALGALACGVSDFAARHPRRPFILGIEMLGVALAGFGHALGDLPDGGGLRTAACAVAPLLRRTSTKGVAFVLAGAALGALRALHGAEDNLLLWFAIMLGASYAFLGIFVLAVGLRKSFLLEQARIHLREGCTGKQGSTEFVRFLYVRYAQATPSKGLGIWEFRALVRDAAGVVFGGRDLELIFAALAASETEMSEEGLHRWVVGGMVLL